MMKKFYAVLALVAVAGLLSPVYAQEAAAAGAVAPGVTQWAVVTAGFALAIAAAFGAMAQGKAVSAAAEGIARNPGAADADPRRPPARSRADRVARDLRAARLADHLLRPRRRPRPGVSEESAGAWHRARSGTT